MVGTGISTVLPWAIGGFELGPILYKTPLNIHIFSSPENHPDLKRNNLQLNETSSFIGFMLIFQGFLPLDSDPVLK